MSAAGSAPNNSSSSVATLVTFVLQSKGAGPDGDGSDTAAPVISTAASMPSSKSSLTATRQTAGAPQRPAHSCPV